jgi:Arabinose efflux permease
MLKQIAAKQIFTPFVLRLLIILFLVEFVKGALLVTVVPVYMNVVLGLSAYVVGWALALQYAGDNLFRTPMGWLIDRIGYRTGIVTGTFLAMLSVLMMAFARNSWWMIAGTTLLGVGTSPLWPSVITGATEEAGESARGSVMSVIYVAWLSGTGVGPVVINFFIHDRAYGLAFTFLLALLAFVFFVSLFLPHRSGAAKEGSARRNQAVKLQDEKPLSSAGNTLTAESSGARRNIQAADATGEQRGGLAAPSSGRQKRSLAAPARRKQTWWARLTSYIHRVSSTIHVNPLFYPALFLQNASIGLLAPVLTLFAKEVLQLSNAMYSLFLVYGGSITILLLYPVGKMVDRFGTRWLLHIGFPLSAAAVAALALLRNPQLTWGIVGAIGVGYAMIIPAWNAFIATIVPEDRKALIWGFFLSIEGGGMVAGSVISGLLWDTFGPHAPFLASSSLLLTLFVLHLFISMPQKIVVR